MVQSMNGGVINELIVEPIVTIRVLSSNFRVLNGIERSIEPLLETFEYVTIYSFEW